MANFWAIGMPLRSRAADRIQRTASVCWRLGFTSVGTWYTEPATRLGRTSMSGVALRRALLKTSIGCSFVRVLMTSIASAKMRRAVFFFPPIMMQHTNFSIVGLLPSGM